MDKAARGETRTSILVAKQYSSVNYISQRADHKKEEGLIKIPSLFFIINIVILIFNVLSAFNA